MRMTPPATAITILSVLALPVFPATARAQESGAVPPTTGGTAPGSQAPSSGIPPLPVLLGYANVMLILDRPFAAEQIYRNILMMDKNNKAALAGLEAVKEAKKPTYTFLGHSYRDSKDTELFAYGGGPILRYPGSRVTVTSGTGYYKNNNNPNNQRNPARLDPGLVPSAEDNFSLRQTTFNVLWEPYWGKNQEHEASVFFSQKNYDNAPDRLLYDVRYSRILEPGRKKRTIGTGRKDSFYSNQINQFLAPESYFMVKEKILFDDYYVGIDQPLTPKIDLSFNYRHFEYSDGNTRDNIRTQFMYRLRPQDPRMPFPVWRVGLDGVIDEAKFFTLKYGIPADFRALSIATDYLMMDRDMKYGVYVSYPIWEKNFAAPAGFVGYASKQVTPNTEVYFKSIILQARNLSISLYDYVLGVNARF